MKSAGRRTSLIGHEPNYLLIGAIGLIVIFGLIMLSSASSVKGFTLHGDPNFFVKRQLLYGVAMGLPLLWVMSRLDYHMWKRYAFPLIIVSIAMLWLVLVPGIGLELLGARRWISVGFLTFQPAELVKLTFLIYLAVWLEARNHSKNIQDASTGLVPFLVMIGFLVVMIAGVQADLGTTIVLGVIALSAYFVAGAPWKHLLIIAMISIVGLLFMIKIVPIFIPKFEYRVQRLEVFLNPELDPQGIGYQINQALLAIGSGGLLGQGLGHSLQKFSYLPEASTDSIFAVISEEMGFIIAVGLLLLYLFFMIQGYRIAQQAPDLYGKILATGITTWVIFQAFINVMAMLSLVPLTGIPLPLVSYGNASMITLMLALGILINISRQTKNA